MSLVLAAAAYFLAYFASLKPRMDELTEAGSLFDQVATARKKW